MSLEVIVSESNRGIYNIALKGSIDFDVCTSLGEKIYQVLAKDYDAVIFDFNDVTYITSMGLGLMVEAQKEISLKNKTLIVINLPNQIKKVFDVIAALPSMNIFKNIQEADEYLIQIQRDQLEKDQQL